MVLVISTKDVRENIRAVEDKEGCKKTVNKNFPE